MSYFKREFFEIRTPRTLAVWMIGSIICPIMLVMALDQYDYAKQLEKENYFNEAAEHLEGQERIKTKFEAEPQGIWFYHPMELELSNVPAKYKGANYLVFKSKTNQVFVLDLTSPAYDAEVETAKLERALNDD